MVVLVIVRLNKDALNKSRKLIKFPNSGDGSNESELIT